jgi:hypothetical protein
MKSPVYVVLMHAIQEPFKTAINATEYRNLNVG